MILQGKEVPLHDLEFLLNAGFVDYEVTLIGTANSPDSRDRLISAANSVELVPKSVFVKAEEGQPSHWRIHL